MNILHTLTVKNLKLNKKRSIMTVIGILLSTALICAVAGMGLSAKKTIREMVKYENGDFHIIFYDLPGEALKYIEGNISIGKTGIYKEIGVAKTGVTTDDGYFDYMQYTSVKAFTKDSLKTFSVHLTEGRYPENDSELLVSQNFLNNGFEDYGIGDTITLELGERYTDAGEALGPDASLSTEYISGENGEYETFLTEELKNTEKKEYTIVGIMERPVRAVQPFHSPAYTAVTCLADEDDREGTFSIAASMKDPSEYKKYLGAMLITYQQLLNKTEGQISTELNEAMLGMDGGMPDRVGQILSAMIVVIVAIVVVTSVFVIRNGFAISVQEKTRQYGMLASIGATSKQIRKNVLFEGLVLGAFGIPLGIALGVGAIFTLVKILNLLLGDLLPGKGFVYSFSPMIFIYTILVSALTIFLSCLIPARRASKIAPVAAIRNNEEIAIKKEKIKTSALTRKLFGIGGVISAKNLKRSRKKYRTTVISLVVSIAVFIGLSAFVEYMKKEINLNMNAKYYNISVNINGSGEMAGEEITRTFRDVIDQIGEEDFGYYENFLSADADFSPYYTDFTRKNVEERKDYYKDLKEQGYIIEDDTQISPDLISVSREQFRKYASSLGIKDGYETAVILVNNLQTFGESNTVRLEHVYDIKEGTSINIGLTKYHEKYTEKPDYSYFDITISAVTDKRPMGYEDNYYDGGILFVSEDFFKNGTEFPEGGRVFESYMESMYINSDDPDGCEQKLKDLMQNDKSYRNLYIYNAWAEVKTARNLVLAVEIFLYGFIGVITLIGVTNIFNTISTNMALRKREFAMLRSVGMTGREFNRMIRLESIMYGTKALLIGLPIGFLLSVLFYKIIGEEMSVGFIFPGREMLISVVGVFVIVWITMKYSMGRIKDQNIIETIRNENT